MDVVAGARLTMAASAAGGFGILGGGYGEKTWLEQETAKLSRCPAPFGIGFITWSLSKRPGLARSCLRSVIPNRLRPPSKPRACA
jgi:nitronate monooxygenase